MTAQPTPQGLHISGKFGDFKFTIGDHDLSDIPVVTRGPIVGPIVENLTPGQRNPARVVWVPFLFEGDIEDPEGILRIVHDGEAEQVGLPTPCADGQVCDHNPDGGNHPVVSS
jgi:hypothetical protein